MRERNGRVPASGICKCHLAALRIARSGRRLAGRIFARDVTTHHAKTACETQAATSPFAYRTTPESPC
ncbi:MAG: hypothetical protein JXA69_05080, partial [Phycisphaerae bacterium]|nr:hypothetical protein [Phycisphaerae bacterium]